jgi:hypothetical protein
LGLVTARFVHHLRLGSAGSKIADATSCPSGVIVSICPLLCAKPEEVSHRSRLPGDRRAHGRVRCSYFAQISLAVMPPPVV